MHNPFRACLVLADGHMVLWDYKHAPFLAAHNPLVAELRSGASFIYSLTGEKRPTSPPASPPRWPTCSPPTPAANRRLAVDKIMLAGFRALAARGLAVEDGEPLTERARAVKGPEEIRAMRCALHACEAAMAEMRAAARPGLSEDEIWAHLHAGNIRRGGEWIETRLLASGPRTNPWFQECGPRIVGDGEILAFDTDLIGPYGYCADISRTWWIGDGAPRPDMRADYRLACEQIAANTALLRPGTSFAELHDRAFVLPEALPARSAIPASSTASGSATSGPTSPIPRTGCRAPSRGCSSPAWCFASKASISRERGDFSIKLEEQVLVTGTGPEVLSRYPPDAALA